MRRTSYASSNGIFYILSDHLQSTSRILNRNNTIAATQYYFPFGGNRGGAFSSLTTKRYTGQYHEASIPGGEGLSYYNARWYEGQINCLKFIKRSMDGRAGFELLRKRVLTG
jgi:hypothetical protein